MYSLQYKLILFVSAFLAMSCRNTPKEVERKPLSPYQSLSILTKAEAADAIVADTIEKFFDLVNPLEMSIQMKRNYPENTNREVILADYKQFLRNDVDSFTTPEAEKMTRILREACLLYNKIEPKAFPYQLKLIKTHAKHYGQGVYYTRQNAIIIPEQDLKLPDDQLLQTMLHEIAHIYTRLNPKKQAELFNLLGFKRPKVTNLVISDSLYKRVFYNPDGIDLAWTTDFTIDGGKNAQVIALIYSKVNAYQPDLHDFMNHMGWGYFETQATDKGLEILTIGQRQQSTLNMRDLPILFLKKFNTNYVIHPNEIIADNIKLLVLSQKDPQVLTPLTNEGRDLLLKIKNVLNKSE
jgi:hypothetical protein